MTVKEVSAGAQTKENADTIGYALRFTDAKLRKDYLIAVMNDMSEEAKKILSKTVEDIFRRAEREEKIMEIAGDLAVIFGYIEEYRLVSVGLLERGAEERHRRVHEKATGIESDEPPSELKGLSEEKAGE